MSNYNSRQCNNSQSSCPPRPCPPRPFPPGPFPPGPSPTDGVSAMRVTNLTPQEGTVLASLINLGYAEYVRGNSINFLPPSTIYVGPGLYFVDFSGDFVGSTIGDTIQIQPLFNGNPIIGSAAGLTFNQALASYSAGNQFFISADREGTITFQQIATNINDTIVDFQVTVVQV